jgi:DNA invertase Pin-like site-specific DNA recombinase
MDYLSIVSKKEGNVIKESNNTFDELSIRCKNNHIFNLLPNDVKLGRWCGECETPAPENAIENALKELGLEFINGRIQNHIFKFIIRVSDDKKFIIEENPIGDEKFKIAQKNGFNIIVIYKKEENLKENIWDAIRNNTPVSYIGKEEGKMEGAKHSCSIIELLDNKESIVMKAPEPWPQFVKYAVGYIRVSTKYQVKDGNSLEEQESKIAEEAIKNNLFLTKLYIDKGLSASMDIEKRLSATKMRGELKDKITIIISKYDRLARNAKEFLIMIEEFKKKGCNLIEIKTHLDTSTANGKFMVTFLAGQAEFESAQISERVKGTMQFMADRGILRTKPKFGLKMNPDMSKDAPIHIPDEREQYMIESIRNLRKRYPDIKITAFTKKVNGSGLETPRNSGVWHHKFLKEIMIREGIWKED